MFSVDKFSISIPLRFISDSGDCIQSWKKFFLPSGEKTVSFAINFCSFRFGTLRNFTFHGEAGSDSFVSRCEVLFFLSFLPNIDITVFFPSDSAAEVSRSTVFTDLQSSSSKVATVSSFLLRFCFSLKALIHGIVFLDFLGLFPLGASGGFNDVSFCASLLGYSIFPSDTCSLSLCNVRILFVSVLLLSFRTRKGVGTAGGVLS